MCLPRGPVRAAKRGTDRLGERRECYAKLGAEQFSKVYLVANVAQTTLYRCDGGWMPVK